MNQKIMMQININPKFEQIDNNKIKKKIKIKIIYSK